MDIWRYWIDSDEYNSYYGYYTGANATGEWLNYPINTNLEGEFRLTIRVAAPYDNRRLHVEFDGKNQTGSLVVPNTGGWGGYAKWQEINTTVTLRSGQQTMRVVIEKGGFNIDHILLEHIGN